MAPVRQPASLSGDDVAIPCGLARLEDSDLVALRDLPAHGHGDEVLAKLVTSSREGHLSEVVFPHARRPGNAHKLHR